MDKVFIRGLEVESVIGVYDWEREILQTLVFDVELGCDISAAAANEDLTKTINYAEVCQTITEFTQKHQHVLIETLAEELSQLLLSQLNIQWLRLRLAKPGAVPAASSVGVEIERSRK